MILDGLIKSFYMRPYVFLFLLGYLFFSIKAWGVRKSFIWLITGYLIALLSEISSINNGFPYGWYSYIYPNLNGELLVYGVPFFDSLSYPFIVFAAFGLAQKAVGEKPLLLILVGALFTMLIDVIVDPVATLGARWFLGEIHQYKHAGFYFGVPITNFLGWYLVAALIIGVNLLINKFKMPKIGIGSLVLFLGIAVFQIGMAYIIGEQELAIAGSAVCLLVLRITYSPKFSI